jgi:hypothetical protein
MQLREGRLHRRVHHIEVSFAERLEFRSFAIQRALVGPLPAVDRQDFLDANLSGKSRQHLSVQPMYAKKINSNFAISRYGEECVANSDTRDCPLTHVVAHEPSSRLAWFTPYP